MELVPPPMLPLAPPEFVAKYLLLSPPQPCAKSVAKTKQEAMG